VRVRARVCVRRYVLMLRSREYRRTRDPQRKGRKGRLLRRERRISPAKSHLARDRDRDAESRNLSGGEETREETRPRSAIRAG